MEQHADEDASGTNMPPSLEQELSAVNDSIRSVAAIIPGVETFISEISSRYGDEYAKDARLYCATLKTYQQLLRDEIAADGYTDEGDESEIRQAGENVRRSVAELEMSANALCETFEANGDKDGEEMIRRFGRFLQTTKRRKETLH